MAQSGNYMQTLQSAPSPLQRQQTHKLTPSLFMQQADDLIDGLMLFRFGASRRILASMTLTLRDGFLFCGSHGLRFYGKLGRVRPVSQAYYESEKLFFCGA
jgi:hypothetical protein